MDFRFTEEQETFRQKIKKALRENPPESFPSEGEDQGYGSGAHSRAFARFMGEQGWISINWPKEYGGQEQPADGASRFEGGTSIC